MQPATSMGVVFASTLVMMVGLGNVGSLAQLASPPTETMPPPGEGAGSSLEAPPAEPSPSSRGVAVPPVGEGQPALPAKAGQVQEQTVSLTQAVHFTDAKGQDVVVRPGSYRVEAEGTNRIRLLPAETGGVVVIDAVSFTHQETVERPVPVTVPDPQQPDVLHLALVSPGSMGLDAIGTYSGVKPRDVTSPMFMSTAISARIAASQTMQFTAVVPGITAPTTGTMAPPDRGQPTFLVVSYGGKCLDFAPPPQVGGAPVFINTCHGDSAQQVLVQEINDRHEVILRAGTKVIGVRGFTSEATRPTVTTRAVGAPSEALLELQIEQNRQTVLTSGAGQIFALDGDSIILVADRTRVVKVLNNRGQDKTPLVLGSRDLADNEFWTFVATDKSGRYPTSGFVRVASTADFLRYVLGNSRGIRPAGPGTVIDVDPNASIDLSNVSALPNVSDLPKEGLKIPVTIQAGVTIRSNRRGTNFGAELVVKDSPKEPTMLTIAGEDVRITGLRLRGPSRSPDDGPGSTGISVYQDLTRRSIIDHNDMSDWRHAAVEVRVDDPPPQCPPVRDPRALPQNVRVARNFLHHNQRQNLGYGVVSYNAFPLIEGNTFVSNRHAIASGGVPLTKYRAWDNLVLSESPEQDLPISDLVGGISRGRTHDFDVHGSETRSFGILTGVGGIGGEYFEIARNTFLGTQFGHDNFDLRGALCDAKIRIDFHHNVSLRSLDGAIACTICGINGTSTTTAKGTVTTPLPMSTYMNILNNHFESGNPTTRLGVGDFDGDGRDDLFLATGAAWYYAPAGNAEWRFLNAKPDGIGTLLFGDFDADGRTDVFTQHGANWDVSWGGASQWDTIQVSQAILGNAAVGDFNGDHYADVFWSDKGQWFISYGSYGGMGQWTAVNTSSLLFHDLGFGDFNGDGKTDVVGATSGQWMVSLNATRPWADFPLRSALTNTMAGLMIADFNGDGRADIAIAELGSPPIGKPVPPHWNWKVSWAGTGNWTPLRTVYGPPVGIGRFDATRGADMLFWESPYSNTIFILSSGVAAPIRQSRQDMR